MTHPTPSPPARHFHRQWWRFAFPALFVTVVFGMIAYRNAPGFWAVGAGLGLVLPILAVLNYGLTVSPEGIAWYLFRPSWRYRVVPWDAVLDVRPTLFGLPPIRLILKHDRYEFWLWGKPKPERQLHQEIWPVGYSGGEEIWDTIHQYWTPPIASPENRKSDRSDSPATAR